jgi:NitT/TauT family transport system permease protein
MDDNDVQSREDRTDKGASARAQPQTNSDGLNVMDREPIQLPERRRGAQNQWTKWLRQGAQFAGSVVALLVIWDLFVRILDIPSYVLPLPLDVLWALVAEWNNQLMAETLVTLQESVLGYLLAIAVSVPIAVLVTYSALANRLVYPPLVISTVIPKIAVAPLFIIWFGFGMFPKVIIAFLVSFFAIVVSTAVALRSLEPNMVHLARSMGATTFQTFWKVRLPNALPTFFGGLKVGVTLAVIGAIVGEFVGSGSGLGHLALLAMGALNLNLVFACIVMMAMVGVVMFGVVGLIEKLTVRGRPTSVGVEQGPDMPAQGVP